MKDGRELITIATESELVNKIAKTPSKKSANAPRHRHMGLNA